MEPLVVTPHSTQSVLTSSFRHRNREIDQSQQSKKKKKRNFLYSCLFLSAFNGSLKVSQADIHPGSNQTLQISQLFLSIALTFLDFLCLCDLTFMTFNGKCSSSYRQCWESMYSIADFKIHALKCHLQCVLFECTM